jgi:hypothetical protein
VIRCPCFISLDGITCGFTSTCLAAHHAFHNLNHVFCHRNSNIRKIPRGFAIASKEFHCCQQLAICVRCSFSDGCLHSRKPLVPTHVRFKRCHAFNHSSFLSKFHSLTGWHGKLRPNTEGVKQLRRRCD